MAFFSLAGLVATLPIALAENNGFGRTPVMGYNTYNAASCTVNQTFVNHTITEFHGQGFLNAGYKFFQIDCGWQGLQRQSNGSITYDSSNFPDGIEPLSKYARGLGFEWGMYTDEGVYACDTGPMRPGSEGHEMQDALQFAGWNVDYLKVDNCWITANQDVSHDANSDFVSRYTPMSNALANVGIEGMLVCQWGVPYINSTAGLQGPAQWTPPLATSFRVSDDMAEGWTNVLRVMNEAINVNVRGLSGPGHFADMDLLEVGNPGMTIAQQQSHFAIWAMFKSTLMVSTPLKTLSSVARKILLNKGLITINQDTLGTPVVLRQRYTNDNDQFYGPLANGDMGILIVDQSGNSSRSLTLDMSQFNISKATVTDLWTGKTTKRPVSSYTVTVQGNGNMAVRLSNIKHISPKEPSYTFVAATSGTTAGGANIQSCSACAGGQKVGYLGSGGTLTLSGISTSQSTQDVLFDYINCDVGFLESGNYANVRGATVSVNGGNARPILFPLSGYNWTTDIYRSFRVNLSGFNPSSRNNSIVIGGYSGTTQYAPDLDGVSFVSA